MTRQTKLVTSIMPAFTHLALSMCILLGSVAPAFAQNRPAIEGDWEASDGAFTLRIAPCARNTSMCGTVVAERSVPGEPSQVGHVILKDVRYHQQGTWQGKFIEGKSEYSIELKLAGTQRLSIKGCVALLLCETQNFIQR